MLQLVVNGYSNKEIGEALALAESTVKNGLRVILEKLHLRNRTQAAVYAVCQGLVPPPYKSPRLDPDPLDRDAKKSTFD